MKEEWGEAHMRCKWKKHISAYVDGTLSIEITEKMQAHLASGCVECREALEKEQRLRRVFTSAAPMPSEEQMQMLENRIMANVRSAPIMAELKKKNTAFGRRSPVWKIASGIAVALLLFVGVTRLAPMFADKATGGAANMNASVMFDKAENEACVGGNGAPTEADGNKYYTSKDELACDNVVVDSETAAAGTVEEYSKDNTAGEMTTAGSTTQPYDPSKDTAASTTENVPPSNSAPSDDKKQDATTATTGTVEDCESERIVTEPCETEATAPGTYTVLIAKEDAARAYTVLNSIAEENHAQITDVTNGWATSGALYSELCAALDAASIYNSITDRLIFETDMKDGYLYLIWEP